MPQTWTIPAAIYDEMSRQGERDFPEETGGVVFGPPAAEADDASALELVALENIQNRLHAEDPERHPRDARTAYSFDAVGFEKLRAEKERAGLMIRSIYHTHPDHDAYFSEKDREDAAPPGWGPLFPESIYIVWSVKGGSVADVKGFTWSDESEDFVDVEIVRGD